MPNAGGTIPYADAVQEVKDYLLVHDKLKDMLDTYLPNPTTGSNLEKMKIFFQSDKLSFAFTKANIDDLFTAHSGANALRIYFGLNGGEPTLILAACTVSVNGGGDIISATNQTSAGSSVPAKQYPRSINPKSGYDLTNFDLAGDSY